MSEKKLTAEEKDFLNAVQTEATEAIELATKGLVKSEELDTIKTQLSDAIKHVDDAKELKKEVSNALVDIKALKEKKQDQAAVNELKAMLTEHSQVLKDIKAGNKDSLSGTVVNKAGVVETAPDIGSRDYLGTIERGIGLKPVRRTSILDVFGVQAVGTEYLHYWEQDVITRDAKFVVACATSEHLTKMTWAKRVVELAKVRDMVDVCIDMLEDYDFVESQLNQLVFESIQLKKESELLIGAAATATDMQSIDSIASEFDPANVLAPFTACFKDANLEQLADSMSAQIQVFGQENMWMPNALVMNFVDFVKYRNLKDANGNKLIHTLSDTVATIAGMEVITSPIVPQNTCYVMDSAKGKILQRKGYTFNISYENRENIEHELATMVAYERVQFYVKNIDQDAFMKCSDVAAAITAITEP